MSLFPSAAICAGPLGDLRTAAATCLVRVGETAHVLTAGHTFPRDATGDEAQVWRMRGRRDPPVPIGTLALNLLDGSDPLDAALVRLDAGVRFVDGPGAAWFLELARTPEHGGVSVLAWLPSRNGCTPVRAVSRAAASELMFRSPMRPDGYPVRRPLRLDACDSVQGDSGAPLLTASAPRRAVGMLVGQHGTSAVYQRLPEVFAALAARVGEVGLITARRAA